MYIGTCKHGKVAGTLHHPVHESDLCVQGCAVRFGTIPVYKTEDDSIEAAVGAGIIASVLESSFTPFIRGVKGNPDQVGPEADLFVYMPGGVVLRLQVTEVKPT